MVICETHSACISQSFGKGHFFAPLHESEGDVLVMHPQVGYGGIQFRINAASIIEQAILGIISPVSALEPVVKHHLVLRFPHEHATNIGNPEKRH